jgi:uncharacterized repeat protein (TIGR01451 family)
LGNDPAPERGWRFLPRVEGLESRHTPAVVTLTPVADNTLYEVAAADATLQTSNGAGQHFYVGDTNAGRNNKRRGALKFDLSAIPAGSTINSVTLTLNMSRTISGTQTVVVHRALASWGEGTSNSGTGGVGSGEGDGIQATVGDATWFYSVFSSQRWTTPGGDFVAGASASTSVGGLNKYQWSGAGMVADVQQWVASATTNFGWILTGNESVNGTSKQFDTRENTTPANRPALTIDFTPPVADLTITKSHTGTFRQGDAADTFSLTVRNVGAGATSGPVTVTDPLPAGLVPTSANNGTINGWAVSTSGQTVIATRSDALSAGASYPVFTLTVSVANTAPPSVTNTATVAGGGEANTANNSASDPVTITPAAADLTISKSHIGAFRQGDAADTFSLTVSNSGFGPTVGAVTVTDSLPTGLVPTAANNGSINGWTVSTSGQTVTATRSDALAVGASYPVLTLTVAVANTAPASVTNTASVAGGGEANTANDSASDTVPITQVADLTIDKSHSGTFRPGDSASTYTITVRNAGAAPTDGSAVTVTDTLPTGLSPTAADSGTVNGWAMSFSGQTVTATRNDVVAGGASYPALTLTVQVAANIASTVTNTATVAGGGEVNTANNSASDITATTPVADLQINKAHTGTFRQGDTADTFSLTVSNIGPGVTAGAVRVTDTLPPGLVPTAVNNGTINGWAVSTSGQTVTATRSDALASGASYPVLTLTVSVANTAPASVVNTATVAGGGQVNTANDSASDTVPITQVADLTISKSAKNAFHPGDTAATYTITVSNVGAAATNGSVVTVTDVLPAGLTPTAANSGIINGWTVSFVGQQVTATRKDVLAAGASYPALTLTVSIASNGPRSVTNTATVAGGGEVNTANNSATDVSPVTPVANLAIAMSQSGNFSIGGTGVFTIVVRNVGGAATNGPVTVTDTLPAGLTYAGPTTLNGWTIAVSGQKVTATRSDALAVGASYPPLTLTVSVAGNAPISFNNVATVSGGGEIDLGNNSATVIAMGQDPRRRGA